MTRAECIAAFQAATKPEDQYQSPYGGPSDGGLFLVDGQINLEQARIIVRWLEQPENNEKDKQG